MIDMILTAVALVLVLEGILPFICPDCWRRTISKLILQSNYALRITGLICMVIGVILLFLIHHGII